MTRIFLLLWGCLLLSIADSPAQDSNLDSLKRKLKVQQGSARLNTLLSISYYGYEYDINSAHRDALKALDDARRTNSGLQQKFALSLIGEYYYNVNDFKTARSLFRQSEQIIVPGSAVYSGYNYILWGSTYRLESSFDSAAICFEKSIPLLEKGDQYDMLHYGYVSYAAFLMDQFALSEARNILEKAMILAKQKKHSANIADVMIEQGRLENLSDEYQKAKILLDSAYQMMPGDTYSYLRLLCVYNLGYVEYNLGNNFKAISYLRELLSKTEIDQYEDIKAKIYALIGKIYMERGEFGLALKSYLDAVKIMERLNMRQVLGQTYTDVAWLYFKQYNDIETLAFLNKAITIGTEIKDSFGLGRAHSVMGSLYVAQNKYLAGINEHEQALEIRKRIQSRAGIAETYFNLGTAYEKMGQIDRALHFANQCMEMDKTFGNMLNQGLSNKKAASIWLKKGNYHQSWIYLTKADSCASKTTSLELRRDVDLLFADWYQKTGDLSTANQYLRKAINNNDSIYSVIRLEKTAEIRGLFDLENIELISRQREQELALQKIKMDSQQNYFLLTITILILVSLLLVIGAFIYNSSRKNNIKLLAEIADRKKAEAQILQSHAQFEEAQSLAHVGSWEYNILNDELRWSKETYRIFEIEDHTPADLYQLWRDKCHPEDWPKLESAIEHTLQTGEPFMFEHRVICRNGAIKYINCIGEAMKDAHGKIVSLNGTDQDITLQKQATLAKSEFIASMSHEIRTPINGVIGIANLLMEEKLTAQQHDYINTLKFSAQHLSSIVSDILDISKIESGKLVFEKVPFSLKAVCSNVFKLFETKATEKQLQYHFYPDPSFEGLLFGDFVRLSQVITNLLSNAIKFTESGSVEFAYVLKENSIDFARVLFTVKDTGIGIDAEQINFIFDKFSQADISTSRRYGGTGLGLSIIKKLVEQQEGKISVKSQAGQGSVFTVELTFDKQLVKPAIQSAKALQRSGQGHIEGMRILVAEDNNINVMVLTPLLKRWGATYKIAKDGLEAIQLLEKEHFDLVIMDLQMPNLDGREATRQIREWSDETRRNIPIVAFTAEASAESQQLLLHSGFNDCITKPFEPERLLATLKKFYRLP